MMSFNLQMDKYNMVHIHYEILFSCTKNEIMNNFTDQWIALEKS